MAHDAHHHASTDAAAHAAHPHGEHHHEHVILSSWLLWAVLLALLGLTGLTVGASFAEKWIAHTWNFEIPQIVNVVVALSIAVVKSLLVCLFFMQLKYDNKINSMVLGFTLFAVALFLGITMLDLHTRGEVYDYKGRSKQVGGLGISTAGGTFSGPLDTGGKGIVEFWRQKYIEEHGQAAYDKKLASKHAGDHHGPALPTASRQAPRSGLTRGLFDATPPSGVEIHEQPLNLNR